MTRFPNRTIRTAPPTRPRRATPTQPTALPRATRFLPSAGLVLLAVCIFLLPTGCNWLIPFIFVGEHKRTVPAEFADLQGKQVAVVVWAEPETLFDYPHIRLELGAFIGDKIRAHVKDCQVLDQYRVEDFIERNTDAVSDPKRVGREFEVDCVVYVELLRFQVRDAAAPDLLRARVDASVVVFNLNAGPDEQHRIELAPVEVVYPENQAVIMSSKNAQLIRRHAYDAFSEKVAQKFFDHKVDL